MQSGNDRRDFLKKIIEARGAKPVHEAPFLLERESGPRLDLVLHGPVQAGHARQADCDQHPADRHGIAGGDPMTETRRDGCRQKGRH